MPQSPQRVADLLSHAGEHNRRLADARSQIDGITWYLYDILGNLPHLSALLGAEDDLAPLTQGQPVADIGAADGDLAFALEKEFGWEVDIIDTPHSNMNGLQGARALRDQLGSSVQIHDIDLDSQFSLPRERYGLVLFLGILYHLKNPFYALQELSRHADHCFISTRIARFAGPDRTPITHLPVGYLVSPTETNNDPTNYWIFSPAGLERLVERAGWTVVASNSVGDTVNSDPASMDHDERAFMLLRSTAG